MLKTATSVGAAVPVGNLTGLGTGVATALGINVGSPGSPVTNGGALGTPSSGVGTNLTGTAAGLTAGNATGSTTAYVPSDQSGATLTFGSVSASQIQIGSLVFFHGTLTFPTTANGSAIKISLPIANGSVTQSFGTAVDATTGTIYLLSIPTSAAYFQLFATPTTGSAILNSALSTHVLIFSGSYNTN